MRYVACMNEECLSHAAPLFDFELAEVILTCAGCGKAMAVSTLAALEEIQSAKIAASEHSEAMATIEAEAEAAKAAPPRDPLVEKLEALGDAPVSASDLLAILRPDTMAADADLSPAKESGDA